MAGTLRLSPDGPNNDDYTCQVATALSEAVRVLNHTTRSRAGIAYPSPVHNVLGRSSTAVAGLDQMLRQIGEKLQRMLTSGRLGADHGTPDERVDTALSEPTAARETARALAVRLDRDFNSTADLHLTAGRED